MLKMKKYVGALTDKLYEFSSRSWELNSTSTADVYDSLGCNIRVYTYGSEVKRILPLKNDWINEDWISNKTRYFFEGLTKWRVNIPLMKNKNSMVYVSWVQAFCYFLLKIWFFSIFYNSKNFIFLNSMFADSELIVTSKILIKKLSFSFFNKKNNVNINDYYLHYLNPNFFCNINDKNIYAFIGYNLRLESPVLNVKLRKRSLRDNILYLSFGSNFNDNLNIKNNGLNISSLIKYLQGKLKICNLALKKKEKKKDFFSANLFLLGNNVVNRIDSKAIFNIINQQKRLALSQINNILNNVINKRYLSNFFVKYSKNNLAYFFQEDKVNVNLNILYVNLTNLLYEEFGLYKNIHNVNKVSENDLIYLLGIDMFDKINSKFTVFQGHHLSLDNLKIDLIFPSTTFLEKFSNHMNIEGDILQTNFVLYPPFFCRNDWSILNAIYINIINFVHKIYNINFNKRVNYLNVNRFYISINDMKKIKSYIRRMSANFYFKAITKFTTYSYTLILGINKVYSGIWKIYNSIISNKYYNPYNLNVIHQYSDVLKACSFDFYSSLRNYQNINKNV